MVNAGAALWAACKARDIPKGMAMAEESLDSGAAARKLDELVRLSRATGDGA